MNNRLFAAIVVVYNFDERTLLMNIESYIHEINHLYIIDNSDINNCITPDSFGIYGDKCTYICLGCNKGIAYYNLNKCRYIYLHKYQMNLE